MVFGSDLENKLFFFFVSKKAFFLEVYESDRNLTIQYDYVRMFIYVYYRNNTSNILKFSKNPLPLRIGVSKVKIKENNYYIRPAIKTLEKKTHF